MQFFTKLNSKLDAWLNSFLTKFHNKDFVFNAVKFSSLFVCLSVLAIFRFEVKNSPKLIARNSNVEEGSAFGVFYKKPEVIPAKKENFTAPVIYATSAIVMDADTFTVLFEQNADEQRSVASTTKIMTAFVALKEFSPTRVISITEKDVDIGGSSMFLVPGEEFLLSDLIKGLLIPSGNDVALTLENEFANFGKDLVGEMNEYSCALGLNNTHFTNSSGLDEDDHYSSARDLAVISSYAMKELTIRSAVSIPETIVYSKDGVHGHYLKSTNELLGIVEGMDGIKTGYTQAAGQCLVASAIRDGHRIITVVLNSPDRFAETEYLVNWAFENYEWR